MAELCLLFRKQVPHFFSIEKIFDTVEGRLKGNLAIQKVYAPFYTSSVLNIIKNILFVRKFSAGIYHVTGDVHYLTLGLPSSKTILTIHDCVFMYNTRGVKKWLFHRIFLKWPVRHCKLVTTISEQSKKDIIKFSGCKEEKVMVIPNMVGESIVYKQRSFNKEMPVILFIGSTPNKNFERSVAALVKINCKLVIIGKLDEEKQSLLSANNINYSCCAEISENELADKYIEADIILFPSLFEGFGLPIVEAQKAGRPVITSNIGPMKDVAGIGACLIDPYSVSEIKAAVIKVITDDNYRNDIIQKGFLNVEQYTPGVIAEKYNTLYKNILNG